MIACVRNGGAEKIAMTIRQRLFWILNRPAVLLMEGTVAIAGTKTLSKLVNHTAKKWQVQSGAVVDLRDPTKRDWVLKKCSVSDV
jgi:hypothetical protein